MTSGRWRRALGGKGVPVTSALLLVVLTINGVAVWGIISAGEGARRSALEDLQLQTTAHAKSLEAVLATLRADLIFLSQSPALTKGVEAIASDDPIARRWGRLDVEGSLLLFLQAHPEVERLRLADGSGQVVAVAGRREGAPVLLPHDEPPPARVAELVAGTWRLEQEAEDTALIQAWIDPALLLSIAAPGLSDRLVIQRAGVGSGHSGGPVNPAGTNQLSVSAPVVDEHWSPPLRWALIRSENENQLVASVETLAGRYRATVVLNMAMITLAVALGLLAVRQVRRAAVLEAENRQQARVRELERQVMHNERLASVGRLAAGIAHEINNPLEGMSNYLALLDDTLRAGETDEAIELTGRVREGLERAAGITRQVLSFADPGKAPRVELDLRAILRNTVQFVRSNPAFRAVRVRYVEPGDPIRVRGNATTLGQLFLNLLMNACQVQSEGGEVELEVICSDEGVTITVRDRGRGFDAESLEHAFEPFYSARGSTGLGLAVCHGIVEEHGGTIAAANRTGGGAALTVVLPVVKREAAAAQPAAMLAET